MNENNFEKLSQQEIKIDDVNIETPQSYEDMYPSHYEITKEQLPEKMDNIDFILAFVKLFIPNTELTKETIKQRLEHEGHLSELEELFSLNITKDGGVIIEKVEESKSQDITTSAILKGAIEAVKNGKDFKWLKG